MGHFPAPRLRVLYGSAIAIGPGKADLLDAIARTGSISAGGRALGMSYRRAWLLIDAMNRSFREPVVAAAKGGAHGGGARLTPFGAEVLACYRALESDAAAALGPFLAAEPPAPADKAADGAAHGTPGG
jgi:molybdate transport system regulatory protein